MIAIAGCKIKRNIIGPVGPVKNVPPKTSETFVGHPVPGHTEDEESNHEQDCDARLQNRAFRRGVSQSPNICIDSIRSGEAFSIFVAEIAPMLTVIA